MDIQWAWSGNMKTISFERISYQSKYVIKKNVSCFVDEYFGETGDVTFSQSLSGPIKQLLANSKENESAD